MSETGLHSVKFTRNQYKTIIFEKWTLEEL